MTRILVIGDDCTRTAKEQAEVTQALKELGLGEVVTIGQFRAVAEVVTLTMSSAASLAIATYMKSEPAPQFGSARPYLKRKKGRS